jgi:hypothetical protein
MYPTAGLEGLYRDSNFDLSVVQPAASRYTDYATAAHRAERGSMNMHSHQVHRSTIALYLGAETALQMIAVSVILNTQEGHI